MKSNGGRDTAETGCRAQASKTRRHSQEVFAFDSILGQLLEKCNFLVGRRESFFLDMHLGEGAYVSVRAFVGRRVLAEEFSTRVFEGSTSNSCT
jgi:hypothetical protein